MEDEIHKAVDVAYAGIVSALYGLHSMNENIVVAKQMAKETEESDVEFRYAKIAGQLGANIDIVQLTLEIVQEKLKDAEAAIRFMKGETR